MMSNYYKNTLTITLHGHKLKGDFILIKFKDDKYEGSWRLIMTNDEYATKSDILLKDRSYCPNWPLSRWRERKARPCGKANRQSEKATSGATGIDELKARHQKGLAEIS